MPTCPAQQTIGRRHLLALPAGLLMPALAALATSAHASTEQPLTLATATPGGGFALYGDTLARVLNARAGRPVLRTIQTRGSVDNLLLLQRGEVDAALIQGTSASEVLAQGPSNGLRILFAMYPSPGMLAVPAASPARRLQDLRGQPVVFGVRTSGLVTLARQVFAGIGLDLDQDFQAIYVAQAAESPLLVQAGRAAALWGAGEGWPGFAQLASGPGGARFIGPSPEQTSQILKKYPLLSALEVPAGTYPGITQALPTVGSVNLILARADLADAKASGFIDAMVAAGPELSAALPQAGFSTLGNTLSSAPSGDLLHRALHRHLPVKR